MDKDLERHMNNVRIICNGIGNKIGLSKQELKELRIAAYYHDIGKLKIEKSILYKPGKLDYHEAIVMKKHSEIGAEILRKNNFNNRIIEAVKHHHERYDGMGYPDCLEKENIPLYARIIAVADSFDAMTSKRCYKDSIPHNQALKEIQTNSGKQFDPIIVKYFFQEMNENIDNVTNVIYDINIG